MMVSLIGHRLSILKLCTDYHRWNVNGCLTSSQPSLKQRKQKKKKKKKKKKKTKELLSSGGKASGSDAIPAEIYKAGGPPVTEKLTELFHICEEKKPSLKDFRMQQLSTYSKGKGIIVRDNHRCVPLLSIAGKILARVLLNRLNELLEQSGLLPESQCGFRKDRGTIEMIFTARQLQEKCQEWNVDLYMTFVDLTEAFDKVSLEGLLKIMAKFG